MIRHNLTNLETDAIPATGTVVHASRVAIPQGAQTDSHVDYQLALRITSEKSEVIVKTVPENTAVTVKGTVG